MSPHLVRVSDVAPQRWRNGGGVTRELLSRPAGNSWQVRVSVADIDADGPFSPFPGVERWFSVVRGPAVELTIAGTPHRLARGDPPLRFDGAAAAHAHLIDGPTRDLNLMLRNAEGSMRLAADGVPWSPQARHCGLFSAVAGSCRADDQPAVEIDALAMLWFDAAPSSLTFTAGRRAAAAIGWWLAATPQKG